MKYKVFLATLALSTSFIVHAEQNISTAESYNIQCLSPVCYTMSDEQMNKIDRMIEDQMRDKIIDKNFSGNKKSVVILNRNKAEDGINLASLHTTESKELLGLSKIKKQDLIETDQTEAFMGFHFSPMKDNPSYLSANVYLDKDPLRDEKDPNAYHVRMNSVGFGKQIREGWTVEIGLIKSLDAKTLLTKFNPAPDGLLLTFKKKL